MIDLRFLKIGQRVRHGTRFGFITGWSDDGVDVSFAPAGRGGESELIQPGELMAVTKSDVEKVTG